MVDSIHQNHIEEAILEGLIKRLEQAGPVGWLERLLILVLLHLSLDPAAGVGVLLCPLHLCDEIGVQGEDTRGRPTTRYLLLLGGGGLTTCMYDVSVITLLSCEMRSHDCHVTWGCHHTIVMQQDIHPLPNEM